MNIGAHVSIAGGIENAPLNARKAKCECFQFFSRSPRGGKTPKITEETIQKFKEYCKKYSLKNYYIHAPYYINLASKNNQIKYGSIKIIRQELERGSLLGAKAVITHLGTAKDYSNKKEALDIVIASLKQSLDGYRGSCALALETSAGTGDIIGSKFEDIAYVMKSLWKKTKLKKNLIGFVLDTCHVFASGYDLRDKKSVQQIIQEIDAILGLKNLQAIHLNDSKTELASHKDRHEHIGKGKIGLMGMKEIINHQKLQKIDFILETPDDKRTNEIGLIKKIRV